EGHRARDDGRRAGRHRARADEVRKAALTGVGAGREAAASRVSDARGQRSRTSPRLRGRGRGRWQRRARDRYVEARGAGSRGSETHRASDEVSDELKVIDGGGAQVQAVLKSLDLGGFKSFVHKRHLEFAPGFTGITGQ